MSGVRAGAAWVAALALLMQVLLAPPLLLRMAADAAWLDAVPTCHASGPGAAEPATPTAPGHDHAHCVLCQNHLLPLLVLPAAAPLLLAAGWRIVTRAYGAVLPRRRWRFECYASRAPPGLIA